MARHQRSFGVLIGTTAVFLSLLLAPFRLGLAAAFEVNLTFNEPNEFNYSYPSNRTFIPCKKGFNGKETCDTLTGGSFASCMKSNTHASLVCVCTSTTGLDPKNETCALNDIRPDCVTGKNACSGNPNSVGYFTVAVNALYLAWTLYVLRRAFLAWMDAVSNGSPCSSKSSTITFTLIGLAAIAVGGIEDVLGVLVFRRHSWRLSDCLLLVIFVTTVSALFNVCIMWVIAVDTAQKMKKSGGINMKRKHVVRLSICGAVSGATMLALFFLQLSSLASMASVVFMLCIALYFRTGAQKLAALIPEAMSHLSAKIKKVSLKLSVYILLYCLLAVVFAMPLPHRTIETRTHTSSFIFQITQFGMRAMMISIYSLITEYTSNMKARGRSSRGKSSVKIAAGTDDAPSANDVAITSSVVNSSQNSKPVL